MTPEQDVYTEAIEKLGYPGSAAGIKYLKLLFTPEEGKLLLEFIKPATCQEVAKKLNIDENSLQERLDHFTMRRKLLYHGKTQYLFYLGLHAFFNCNIYLKEEYLPAGFWPAYAEFHLEEMEQLANRLPGPEARPAGAPPSRIMPARLALAASPRVKPEQVLWYEDMAHILKENCMGCGSCILGCKQKGITFELVRPPEHIPTQPLRPRTGLYPYGYGCGKPGDGLD